MRKALIIIALIATVTVGSLVAQSQEYRIIAHEGNVSSFWAVVGRGV